MPAAWFDICERPGQNELVFEWIDLLDAVATGGNKVTIIDLGSGYGRWLVIAAIAAKQLGKSYHVVGVEAETAHFRWMIEHLADNAIDPRNYTAINAPVADRNKDVIFVEGHSEEWYGQSILEKEDSGYGDWPNAKLTTLRAVSAETVIRRYPLIDSLHMDIQGEEMRVVPSIMEAATRNVRRMHVETHWPEIDATLPKVFERYGWVPRCQFPCSTAGVDTQFGKIDFQGGVQSWGNPNAKRMRFVPAVATLKRAWERLISPASLVAPREFALAANQSRWGVRDRSRLALALGLDGSKPGHGLSELNPQRWGGRSPKAGRNS